ncbi:MAG: bifunctional pyr operon transcriptional regulator/uracil phosphoribosyltransferase PyrR, partial [Flavobacteriales bacterium]
LHPTTILNRQHFNLTLERLAYQIVEEHGNLSDTVLLGIQPRGTYLANKLADLLKKVLDKNDISPGTLDITFYRDDIRKKEEVIIPKSTDINVSLENKNVILIDDVLYTGRTIRAALDAMLSYGRPFTVELLVLVDRRFRRQLPVKP